MRVKIIRKTYKYNVDQVVEVSKNEGFGLIDAGFGIMTKDMTAQDYKVTKPKKAKKRG